MREFWATPDRAGLPTVPLAPEAGESVLVSTLSPQVIPDSSPPTLLTFDADPDLNDLGAGVYNASLGRLVVPPGAEFTRVRLWFKVIWAATAGGIRSVSTLVNGSLVADAGAAVVVLPGVGDAVFGATFTAPSAPIAVSPGDFFNVGAIQTTGAPLNVNGASFAMEVLR